MPCCSLHVHADHVQSVGAVSTVEGCRMGLFEKVFKKAVEFSVKQIRLSKVM